MLGCVAGHMRLHGQKCLALSHSEKQAHFEGNCLALYSARLLERNGSHRAVRDACLLPKQRPGTGPLFGAFLSPRKHSCWSSWIVVWRGPQRAGDGFFMFEQLPVRDDKTASQVLDFSLCPAYMQPWAFMIRGAVSMA